MGLASAPDIFQSIMMDLLGDLDYVLVYIDDILILQREGETEEDHLQKLDTVLLDWKIKDSKQTCVKHSLYGKNSSILVTYSQIKG